jgi:hypothetical protein
MWGGSRRFARTGPNTSHSLTGFLTLVLALRASALIVGVVADAVAAVDLLVQAGAEERVGERLVSGELECAGDPAELVKAVGGYEAVEAVTVRKSD